MRLFFCQYLGRFFYGFGGFTVFLSFFLWYVISFSDFCRIKPKLKLMKKITLLAVAALAMSFASCKKDRTCTCTNISSNGNTTTSTITIKEESKKTAKDFCFKSTNVSTYGSTTSNSSSDCKLS